MGERESFRSRRLACTSTVYSAETLFTRESVYATQNAKETYSEDPHLAADVRKSRLFPTVEEETHKDSLSENSVESVGFSAPVRDAEALDTFSGDVIVGEHYKTRLHSLFV